jgi:hypothetical protein
MWFYYEGCGGVRSAAAAQARTRDAGTDLTVRQRQVAVSVAR